MHRVRVMIDFEVANGAMKVRTLIFLMKRNLSA